MIALLLGVLLAVATVLAVVIIVRPLVRRLSLSAESKSAQMISGSVLLSGAALMWSAAWVIAESSKLGLNAMGATVLFFSSIVFATLGKVLIWSSTRANNE